MTHPEIEPLLRGAANEAERRLLESAKEDASRPQALGEMLAALGVPAVARGAKWSDRLLRHAGMIPKHVIAIALLVGAAATTSFVVSRSIDEPGPNAAPVTTGVASARHDDRPTGGLPSAEPDSPSVPVVSAESLPSAHGAPTVAGAAASPFGESPTMKGRIALNVPSPPPSPTSNDALDREIARVEAARAALGRNEPERTLRALEGYDREFPHGAFAVEVSVLRIEALVRSGRTEEARRLGSKFLAEHREGAFARRVAATLATTPGSPSTRASGD